MTMHFRFLTLATSSLAIAFGLAACGGGGSSSSIVSSISATAGDKYIGTWWGSCVAAATTGAVLSYRGVSVITKAGDNLYTLTDRTDQFALPGCAGTATAVPSSQTNFKITGTSNVGGVLVDRVATPDFTAKDLMYLPTPTTFVVGDPASGQDSEGYPNTLSTGVATKQ